MASPETLRTFLKTYGPGNFGKAIALDLSRKVDGELEEARRNPRFGEALATFSKEAADYIAGRLDDTRYRILTSGNLLAIEYFFGDERFSRAFRWTAMEYSADLMRLRPKLSHAEIEQMLRADPDPKDPMFG